MSLPNRIACFVCGVQKAGTTSMDNYLRRHPQLSAPDVKELHFFDDEDRDWRCPNYRELEPHYQADETITRGEQLRFEVTPIYSFWPPSLARIRDYNPAAKLIFLFRDPFDRAWSQWCMEYARGCETLPFDQAIRDGRQRLVGLPELAPERRIFSYVERGYYGAQVAHALTLFPRAQLLFLKSADLARDHGGVLARVAAFLQIGPFPAAPPMNDHRRPDAAYPAQPTAADRALIRTELVSDMAAFTDLTGIAF
jgi:hypothetical protein